MKPHQLRQIGKTSLNVTQFGLGGTTLGNIYSAVEEQAALDTTFVPQGGVLWVFALAK